jgi:flagellar hook-length control protein FliK
VSQSDVLAIFTPPQAPVEQVVAPQKYDAAEDDGFKRIMDDASNKVSSPKEGNKSDTDRQDAPSAQTQQEKKPIEKIKDTDNKQINKIDKATQQETIKKTKSAENDSKIVASQDLESTDHMQEAVDTLKKLGFDVEAVDTLLEIFKSDSSLNVVALLQTLTTQNYKLNDFSLKEFLNANSFDESSLSQLENRKGLINDLLKLSGLTDQETKNLIQKLESQQLVSSKPNNQLIEQASPKTKKAVGQSEVINLAGKDLMGKNSAEKNNESNNQLDKNLDSHSKEKIINQGPIVKKSSTKNNSNSDKNKNSIVTNTTGNEKVVSTNNQTESKTNNIGPSKEKIESSNTLLEKNATHNSIGMKYSSANGLDASTSKNLEAIKINGEIQVQNSNVATENNNKTASTTKATLPENSIYKAPIENRVIDQIINRLSVRSNGSQSEVKIRLDPPSLGTVRMNISTSVDGVRTLIVAENQAVKQLIENNLSQLRDSMANQGLKLDGFSVQVGGDSNPGFSQQQESLDKFNTNGFGLKNKSQLEEQISEESTRQTSFIFDDISQTFSVVA